jgi:predicted porin
MKIFKDHIKVLSDTSSNLNTDNPVLVNRELAYESDTGRVKMGNNQNQYQDLGYWDQVGPVFLKPYTVAQAEAVAGSSMLRAVAWISNDSSGAQPAYCDGTNWIRFTGTQIS